MKKVLYLIGSPKSGTTSFFENILLSKSLIRPKIKESHFLISDVIKNKNYIYDVDEYKRIIRFNEDKCSIDASIFSYLYPEKFKKNLESLPKHEPIIIFLIRNPIKRAISAFNHETFNKKEFRSFNEAINSESEILMQKYIQCSDYKMSIKFFREKFPNFHLIKYEDFVINKKRVINNILDKYNFQKITKIDETKYNNTGKIDNKFVESLVDGKSIIRIILRPLLFFVPISLKRKFILQLKSSFMKKQEIEITFRNQELKRLNNEYDDLK